MAKKIYTGVNDLPKNVTKAYVSVNNVPKKIVKAYVGVNGVPKLFWDGSGGGDWEIDDDITGSPYMTNKYYHGIDIVDNWYNYSLNNTYPITYYNLLYSFELQLNLLKYYLPSYSNLQSFISTRKQEMISYLSNALTNNDNYIGININNANNSQLSLLLKIGTTTISEFTPSTVFNSGDAVIGSTSSGSPTIVQDRIWIQFIIGVNSQFTKTTWDVSTNETIVYTFNRDNRNTNYGLIYTLRTNLDIKNITKKYYNKISYFNFINNQTLYDNINKRYYLDTTNTEFTLSGLHFYKGNNNFVSPIGNMPDYLLYYGDTIKLDIGDYTLLPYGIFSSPIGGYIFQIPVKLKFIINNINTGMLHFLTSCNGRWYIYIHHSADNNNRYDQYFYITDVNNEDYFKNSILTIQFDNNKKGIILYRNDEKIFENYNTYFNGIQTGQKFSLLGYYQEFYLKKLAIANKLSPPQVTPGL